MTAWMMRTMVALGGVMLIGCTESTTPPGSSGTTSTKRTKWKVTGVLNNPHYPIAGSVHARVSAQFSLEVDFKQPYDANANNGPVAADGIFNLISFSASDQHYHPPLPNCIQPSFGGTIAWAPQGGLYQRVAVGFRVSETLPSYRLPIGEGACDTLGAETPSANDVKDILVFVPAEVSSGREPPGGGWVNLGEETTAAESDATSSETDWVLTWTAP